MKVITLRNIPPEVAAGIELRSKQTGLSRNKTVIRMLEESLGTREEPAETPRHDDLLARFLASTRVRTLVIDPETAERYALIYDALRRAGTPIPTNDVWIAASAMQFGLRVITTDGHFDRVTQIIVELCPA